MFHQLIMALKATLSIGRAEDRGALGQSVSRSSLLLTVFVLTEPEWHVHNRHLQQDCQPPR